MSLFLKMIYGSLTGAWGGLAAWALLDRVLQVEPANPYLDALLNGAVIGICVGALMGGFVGVVEGSWRRSLRGLAGGLATGFLGGALGLLVGEALFQGFAQRMWVRATGWAFFGITVGAGEGLLIRSWRRVLFGAAGGLLGGVAGSLAFMAVKSTLTLPAFGRALGFTILGALLGLFIGLVPVVVGILGGALKVISSGRNEGKEILLDKPVIRIGRDDRCDLRLAGDERIQPVHAEIRRESRGYLLHAVGSAAVRVNGQPAADHLLQKGDRIGIGREEVLYR